MQHFYIWGGGKIEHSIFHFFVFLTFAGAKVLLFYELCKSLGKKNAPHAARAIEIPHKQQKNVSSHRETMYLPKQTIKIVYLFIRKAIVHLTKKQ